MFFGSKKLIGLDIGSSSIKMAELEVTSRGARVISFGMKASPPNSFNNGDVLSPDAIGQTIRQIVQEHKIKRKAVCMGMSGTSVIVKKITIPRIDRKLLADQVRWEAEQYIPFDVNNISLTYHVIESRSSDMMDLLLVAAQNQVVAAYSQVVGQSGLSLSILDVSGFALANIFEFNYGRMPGQTIGVLNIGATTTNFVVVYDGEVVFTRDMNIGGQNYTSEIHKEMGVSLSEAESLKMSAIRGEGVPDEVHSIMSAFNENLKEEVRNSFDYFSGSATNQPPIGQCFFTGGASGTPGLIEAISQSTGVRMEGLNAMLRMNEGKGGANFDRVNPFSAVAFGLALRKGGDS